MLAPIDAGSTAVPAAHNLDFEQGREGEMPLGWSAPGAAVGGFIAATTREAPRSGQSCLEIRRDTGGSRPLCYVRQVLDAAPYRGHRVRLSGWLRFAPSDSEDIPSSARIWMTVMGKHPMYEDLGAHPVRSSKWTLATLVCEVASDADSLAFGAMLDGYGRTWADDLQIIPLGPNGEGNEPPRSLGERGTQNLVAFGRLLGYVRHFHPSDEAAATDWNEFAIAGVDEVEDARTPVELMNRLERLFRPIAPTLRLGTKALPPVRLSAPGAGGIPTQIVGWRHRGWPDTYSQIYSERRVSAPAGAPGDSLLPVGSEVNTALGGGVWCAMPMTLYVGVNGTVPRAAGTAPAIRRVDGWIPSGNDRATRLADVILFWNAMQHFFPYFDVTDTDWPSQLPIALRAAATDSSIEAFERTLRRLSEPLHDGHVFVQSPYFRYETLSWPFAWSFVEDRLVVVHADSMLAKGVHGGDEVVAIQGRPVSKCVLDAEALESGATPQRIRIRTARALLSSSDTDTLTLELRTPTGSMRQARVTRHQMVSLTPMRPDSVQEVAPGVMYLDMNRITDADFLAAIPKINQGKGVIFDLRGYPYRVWTTVLAHLTDSTLTSAKFGVPVILQPDHRDMNFAWTDWSVAPEGPRIKARAAFLMDGNAISASETLLGIVEHYRLADLVGESSAGTTGNVTFVRLPGRYSITFTGMKVLKQDGSRHHGIGILPTVPVSPTIVGLAAGRDEQLERAIEVVRR